MSSAQCAVIQTASAAALSGLDLNLARQGFGSCVSQTHMKAKLNMHIIRVLGPRSKLGSFTTAQKSSRFI